MIGPTDEMERAAERALTRIGTWDAVVAAVLALVERDHVLVRRCPHGSDPQRCGPCTFDAAIPKDRP